MDQNGKWLATIEKDTNVNSSTIKRVKHYVVGAADGQGTARRVANAKFKAQNLLGKSHITTIGSMQGKGVDRRWVAGGEKLSINSAAYHTHMAKRDVVKAKAGPFKDVGVNDIERRPPLQQHGDKKLYMDAYVRGTRVIDFKSYHKWLHGVRKVRSGHNPHGYVGKLKAYVDLCPPSVTIAELRWTTYPEDGVDTEEEVQEFVKLNDDIIKVATSSSISVIISYGGTRRDSAA